MKNNLFIQKLCCVIITILFMFIIVFPSNMIFASEDNNNNNEVNQGNTGNNSYNLYFGQIHMHSENSACGRGKVEKAYTYARDTGKLDFMVLTDHSNDFDNGSKGNILDGSCSKEWTSGHEIADKYTDENFVAMYGYEMTWSNGNGHMNTYNTRGFESRDNYSNTKGTTKGVSNYYKTLKDRAPEAICQINHPNQGTFGDFAYYDKEIDKIVNLIEAGRGMGLINGKGTCTSSSKWERMEKYFYQALDKGWHLAPTAGQDDHSEKWGTTNPARTVVLADKLTRENIYDALRNRRCYASEDSNLQIKYTLNNAVMGSITGKAGDTANIVVNYKETSDDKIDRIRVMVDGQKEIANKTVNNAEGTITFEVPSKYSYYVVEVYEKDNDFAITAPIWIDKSIEVPKELYIANIDTNASNGNKIGSLVEFSANVKNNTENIKYKYSIKDKDGNLVKLQDYSSNSSLKWTPETLGQYTIVLEVQDSVGVASKEIKYIVKDDNTIATIYYEGYDSPYIHYCINGKWTPVPGVAMEKSNDVAGYSYKAKIDLGDAEEMKVCFNDGNGKWDSNSPEHYIFGAGYYTFSNGKITEIENPEKNDDKKDPNNGEGNKEDPKNDEGNNDDKKDVNNSEDNKEDPKNDEGNNDDKKDLNNKEDNKDTQKNDEEQKNTNTSDGNYYALFIVLLGLSSFGVKIKQR